MNDAARDPQANAQGNAQGNAQEWSVSELSAALKRTVEDAYGFVRVRGEVSGFKGASPSGHVYFRLKDDRAVIEAVIWKGVFGRMRVRPEEGLDVLVSGKLTTYPGSSKYQIVIDTLEPAGVGALMKLLEERKKKLAAEGLFDPARKQLLPFLPTVIGVVTSPTGAVIRDILHRLGDRFPRHVLVWPVRVQGEQSAGEVANAIHGFNALPEDGPIPRPDLIIVARGGGSLEDLWSFNEEIVVRAAADSMIPLISAVGHETDVTLIDFASDKRAPTPTAAAEMAVPVRAELMLQIAALGARKLACWQRGIEQRRKELTLLSRALPAADEVLAGARQRLDACAERLPRALRANAQLHRTQLTRASAKLSPRLLRHRLERGHEITGALGQRSAWAFRVAFDRRTQRVQSAGQLLAAFSYRGVLARGFALVRDAAGVPLRTAASVASGARLDIEFADGRIAATAGEGATPPTAPRVASSKPVAKVSAKPPKTGGAGGGQGDLF
ncbi:MAG: exodeoxyribonuclease VII large subunit [Xanthobacteraceae bacterium]|uniref:exodeoxyribonuclease VII large subunit n=1 Tax=Pseudolabrys sp. TaxID=1960880 RepID=UPI003D0B7E07